jgi:hypothetical protein
VTTQLAHTQHTRTHSERGQLKHWRGSGCKGQLRSSPGRLRPLQRATMLIKPLKDVPLAKEALLG